MKLFSRVCYLALALTAAVLASGCGASAGAGAEPSGDEEDDSWGEASQLGKADGVRSEATIAARKEVTAKFELPTLTEAEQQAVLDSYASVDPNREAPRALLESALLYYDFNRELLENTRYITLIDFSQHSSKRRLYLFDMESGALERHVVAHGSGSDPEDDGIPSQFSNVHDSHKSSLGFYLTAETYSGKWGLSLVLDGLSQTNSNARSRAVVMHGASYVVEGKSKQGRSWGCPAIPLPEKDELIAKLKGGSLMYAERSEQ